MCTVTSHRRKGRLLVVMNRDERWGRAPEIPPVILGGDERWMAPHDGEKGGTWIGVNEEGVVACLLNRYRPGDFDLLTQEGVPSRGEIVPTLLQQPADEVFEWLRSELRADRYPSFSLLVWTATRAAEIRWWIDEGMSFHDKGQHWQIASSSAWRTEEVLAWRTEQFAAWQAAGAPFGHLLPTFHTHPVDGMEMWSAFMTRPFSATRSLTRLEVDWVAGRARLDWWKREGANRVDAAKPSTTVELSLSEKRALE